MADYEPPREDRVLLVEGQDDKHVVLHLRKRSQAMPPFCISDKGDLNSLLDSIGPEIKAPGPNSRRHSPGRHRRSGRAMERLDASACEARPPSTATSRAERNHHWLPVHVLEFGCGPTIGGPGELEDFVKAMIPRDDGIWPLAQAYVNGIPEAERRFPTGKTLKAQLHAWLATRRTPGRMGSAIGTGDLEVDGPVAERLANWLRRLFS